MILSSKRQQDTGHKFSDILGELSDLFSCRVSSGSRFQRLSSSSSQGPQDFESELVGISGPVVVVARVVGTRGNE